MQTPETLSESKRKLLQMYIKGEASRQSRESAIVPREPGVPVPLAPSQQQVWLHSQMAPTLPLYNEPITIHFKGELDREVFSRTFTEILRRHEIWRTSFASIDGKVVQAVHDVYPLDIPFHDLSELPEFKREAESMRLATADAQRPFDMAVGPLLRARMFKMGHEDYRFHLTLHHIIFDGVAIYRTLIPEIAAIYKAFSEGAPSPLAEPKLQYSDYALWQQKLLDNDSVARQMTYWREQLSGELPNLELATDRPRPAVPTYRGTMETFTFTGELTEALKKAASKEGVTLYMFLLAGFKALLYRYTGQEDILVGGVTDGRRHREFEPVIGFFLNTLVMRTKPSGSLSFRDFLAQVKETVVGALSSSDVPFDRLVRELQPKRDPSRHPLFQVLFSIEPPATAVDSRWDLTQMDISPGTSKFDLYLELDERPEGLIGRFMYSTDLFEQRTIQRMIGHWLTMLEGAVAAPEKLLAELPLMTSAELVQVRDEWNDTRRQIVPMTVHELFETQVSQSPLAVAVECDGEFLTYRELNRKANRLARRLREAGAGPGKVVGLCIPRSCAMVTGLLAVLKSGATYLPIDPSFPTDRKAFLLADSQAPILLVGDQAETPETDAKIIHVDEVSGTGNNFESGASMDGAAYLLYTSGSTGRPKGVEIPHSALTNFLSSMRREPGFSRQDTMLAVTTLSFDIAGLEIYLPLITGGRLVIAAQAVVREPELLMKVMENVRPSVMQATPALWRALVDAGWAGDPELKVLCGGEALPRTLANELLQRSQELWNMYGPTETTIWSTVDRVVAGDGPMSIGRPIANTSLFVLDRDQRVLPVGVVGELYIGGDGLALGYRNREELTAEKFVTIPAIARGRLYRTGDLARWNANGTMECLGRADNQVKVRGFRVELEEIEAVLSQAPGVRMAAVRTWPDATGNASLTAYVVPSPNGGEEGAWRQFLRQRLPDYMVPNRFVSMETLPLTPNAKVDRKALPAPLVEGSVAVRAPADEIEQTLIAIWQEVFETDAIRVDSDFFQLGGHSLMIARLTRRIEQEMGVRLSMGAIFSAPTLETLAAVLRERDSVRIMPRTIPFQTKGEGAPLFWVNAGPAFRPLAAHMGSERPFIGVTLDPKERESLPEDVSLGEIATYIVRAIRAAQPAGPYYIAGFCASGILAYETAVQLQEAGETVASLVLLEAPNPQHWRNIRRSRALLSRLAFHAGRLSSFSVKEKWQYFSERLRRGVRMAGSFDVPETAFDQKLFHAALHYNPRPFHGIVKAFQAEIRPRIFDLRDSWASAPARVEVQTVGGDTEDHRSTHKEPHVAGLALRILEVVRERSGVEMGRQRAAGF